MHIVFANISSQMSKKFRFSTSPTFDRGHVTLTANAMIFNKLLPVVESNWYIGNIWIQCKYKWPFKSPIDDCMVVILGTLFQIHVFGFLTSLTFSTSQNKVFTITSMPYVSTIPIYTTQVMPPVPSIRSRYRGKLWTYISKLLRVWKKELHPHWLDMMYMLWGVELSLFGRWVCKARFILKCWCVFFPPNSERWAEAFPFRLNTTAQLQNAQVERL